ncbi:MAG TPA: hypothetical protein V6C88_03520 [Chroococcidiopsis sp.]
MHAEKRVLRLKKRRQQWLLGTLLGIAGATTLVMPAQAFNLSHIETTLSRAANGSSGGDFEHDPLDSSAGNLSGSATTAEDGLIGDVAKGIDGFGSHLSNIGGFSLSHLFESVLGHYTALAESYLNTWTTKTLGELLGGIKRSNTGDLGQTDPAQTSDSIGTAIGNDGKGNTAGVASANTQKQDVFNQNPVVVQQSLTHATQQDDARGSSEIFLGEAGQQVLKSEMQSAQANLQDIQAHSDQAQSMDVTQDVEKNLTAMVNDQSQLEAGSYSQLMQLNQQQAEANVVNADVSESLDELNRSRHAEVMSGAYDVMAGAANLYLPGSGATH